MAQLNKALPVTVIIPIEDFDLRENKDYIDALVDINLGRQTFDHSKIYVKFLTYAEPGSQDILNDYKDQYGFADVEVLYTQDKTLTKLDFSTKTVTTPFYCFKTISVGELNGNKCPSLLEYLPHHFEHCLEVIRRDRGVYLIPFFELTDMDEFGNDKPTMFEIVDQENFQFEYIKLDTLLFSKELRFSFKEAIYQHPQTHQLQFAPGFLVAKWMEQKKLKGCTSDIVTMREYISSDQVRKSLRLIVDGQTLKAIPAQ